MENTKLIKVLKTFSKQEIKSFKDFVNSPFFNKNRNVIDLAEAVLSYHPDFDSGNLSEENIYKKIFGKEKFDYFKIKNIISDLYQLAINFLKTVSVNKNSTENEIALLNELHDRKLDIIYSQREKKVSAHLESLSIRDEAFYLLRHQLGKINTAHYKFEKTGYTFNQIQNEFDTLLDYSLIGLLRLYSKMMHNKNHGNINFSMEMFENIWEYVKDKEFEGNPSCQIYKQLIQLELTKDEAEYRKLLELKAKYNDNIPREDMYYILNFINSFAVYRLKLGDESYYKDRFMAFRETLERNFIPSNNFLFVNFISTYTSACMVEEYSWAESFMHQYAGAISPEEEKQNTVNYCNAFLAFRMKEYDKALEYFAKTNFKLYLMKVMVKSYSLRIFYEQNMHEQTLSSIDSFRHYLKSEKMIAEEQKLAHYEFLKHVTDLTDLKHNNTKKRDNVTTGILKKRVTGMNSNPLGAKNWLIEKINEIETKKL